MRKSPVTESASPSVHPDAVPHDLTKTFELVRRAQAGESSSLDRLCARYYPRVLRITRARIARDLRTVLETEDIAQSVFHKAVRQFDRFEFRNDASLINWLARIVECELHDHRDFYYAKQRDMRRVRPFETRTGSATRSDPADPEASPPEAAARGEHEQLMTAALGELPEEHRELILLREFCGFSWAEVAREVGRPTADSARMAHASAIVGLRRALTKRGLSDQGASS